MQCQAIVPTRWHTPAHQCTFKAVRNELCAAHDKMRCEHKFDTTYRIQIGKEFRLLSWCTKCGTLSIADHAGPKLTHPENYATTNRLKVLNIP